MSILLKGLKMPKGDKALVIVINSNGTVDKPNWQWDCTLIKGAEAIELPDYEDLEMDKWWERNETINAAKNEE